MCACIDTRAVAAYEDVKGTRLETALGRKPLTLLLFRARSHHTRSAICCAIVPVEKYAADPNARHALVASRDGAHDPCVCGYVNA